MKAFILGKDKARIIFASELKGLFAAINFKPTISKKSIELFLGYGYIPAPHTYSTKSPSCARAKF